jgi:hypothetical protein
VGCTGCGEPRSVAEDAAGAATPAIAGGLIGLAAALALARTFRALLFDIEPVDPLSLAAGGAALLAVALAAAIGPEGRAAAVDPVYALRVE